MQTIKVKDVMSKNPVMVKPSQTVREAAAMMRDNDCGVLPVGDPKAVIGVLTDRDITVRVTAEGKDASKLRVEDVMTHKFITCNENDDIEHAAELMRKHDVSRVMVSNFDTVTGIATLADLIRNRGDRLKSEQVLNTLLRPYEKPQKLAPTAAAAAGCESCDG